MDRLYSVLKKNEFKMKVRGSLGTTFNTDMVQASILKSGIMIVEGVNSEREAYDFYFNLMVNGLEGYHKYRAKGEQT